MAIESHEFFSLVPTPSLQRDGDLPLSRILSPLLFDAEAPRRRIGRPKGVRRVVFLASEDASFMTGTAVVVSGGFGGRLPAHV